jgi:hypothetical protein
MNRTGLCSKRKVNFFLVIKFRKKKKKRQTNDRNVKIYRNINETV